MEAEIIATCHRLARHPLIGHKRKDITSLPVRFWTVPKYPNYVIVYRPLTEPLQIVAILHGKRESGTILNDSSDITTTETGEPCSPRMPATLPSPHVTI